MAVTNFEFYKDEIKAVEYRFGLNKKGEIVHCERCECKDCILNTNDFCSVGRIKWLYEEHKEQPKLTKNARKLCEILRGGYVKRGGGKLWWSEYKNIWWPLITDVMEDCDLPFIKEDEEIWSVEDLLKLEVMYND